MRHVPEYIFSKLAREVTEVEGASGRKVLSFGAGSPDFPPSDMYTQKLAEYVAEPGSHMYPGYKGLPEFNAALTVWYKKRFGVVLTDNEVLPLCGAKDGVAHLPLAVAEPGDEILVPNPGYPAYITPAEMVGVTVVSYPCLTDIERLVTPKTKAIWVNFPSNPTGQVATMDELKILVNVCRRHDLILMYDNAYADIVFDGYVAPSILEVKGAMDVAVEIGSFSKSFSFAGYRMGWMVGNATVVKTLLKTKSQFDSGLSLPLQRLGAYALIHPDTIWTTAMLLSYKQRRDKIADMLRGLGLTFTLPKAGLYIWAKIPDNGLSSEEYCRQLLHTKQILLVPGTAFGSNGEGWVRVSICVNISTIEEYL